MNQSIKNYTFAVVVGLLTSFVYFTFSPLQDAYSELLARTSPTIFDVVIAFFGGLAGMLANSSKQKGNVIPGVAIATALMPPLCTAGYGLATLQFNFFFSALYLFTINTVFIALATFLTVKFLNFPIHHSENINADRHSRRIISVITFLTLIPSVYFGYLMIQENRFVHKAKVFIETQATIDGNYLLKKEVDPQKKLITLVFGGKDISKEQIDRMKRFLPSFGLENTTLTVRQGISFLNFSKESDRVIELNKILIDKSKIIDSITNELQKNRDMHALSEQVNREVPIIYPEVGSISVSNLVHNYKDDSKDYFIAIVNLRNKMSRKAQKRIDEYLRVRLNKANLKLFYTMDK